MEIKKLNLEIDESKLEKGILEDIAGEVLKEGKFLFGSEQGYEGGDDVRYKEKYYDWSEHSDYRERPHRDSPYRDGRVHRDRS
jgi:hypothetical protein